MSELPPQPGYETVHQYEPGPPNQPPPKKGMSPWIIVLLAIGGMCVLGIPIMAALLFPVFSQAKVAARKTATMSSMKQASLGIFLYQADHDDLFPPAENWQKSTLPYIKNELMFVTSAAASPADSPYYFAFAAPLSQMSTTTIESPSVTILLFESSSKSPSPFGGSELLPPEPYHGSQTIVSHADGSAKSLTKDQIAQTTSVGSWTHFPVKEQVDEDNWIIR